MTQITNATFEDGVLRPEQDLHLRPNERVRIIVQQLNDLSPEARAQAVKDLFALLDRIGFKSEGPYPTRDELHERD